MSVEPLAPPEANLRLVGHEVAEQALLDAFRSGRVHHAWLIDGPAGIGKATLAFRFARFVLTHPDPTAPDVGAATDLSVPGDASAARQMRARANPDLMVLERPRDEEGRVSGAIIPVDAVRRAGRFLAGTAASGGWRIVVVDAADDLNRASANALLKMLEEPPDRTLFLLVTHVAGRLLPTVRSRCRRLSLQPLEDEVLTAILDEVAADAAPEERRLAVQLSQGSLGRALEIAGSQGGETARTVLDALERLPSADPLAQQGLAERLGRRGAEDSYRLATVLMLDWIAERARAAASAGTGPRELQTWPELWETVTSSFRETDIYNLDRTQTLLAAFRAASAAAARTG